jgi:hypothetical protein
MLRSVYHIIRPSTARPSKVRQEAFGDVYDFDITQVELEALREVLQTTIGPNPFSTFLGGFLTPYNTQLIWLGRGPGIGKEMRRAFSAIFGRFFARTYLKDCHGYVWFCPLDGPFQQIAPRLRVKTRGKHPDLPDWICAGARGLALAEAKGAKGGGRLKYQSQPGAIKTAVKQLENCQVSVFDQANQRWVDRRVKGWAVLNQWSFQSSNVPPYLFVVDPQTDGESLPPEDLPALARVIAREHVGGLCRGLGLFELASLLLQGDELYATAFSQLAVEFPVHVTTVSVPALGGAIATGRLFNSDFGAMSPAALGAEIFIGMQVDVVDDLRSEGGVLTIVAPRSLPSEGVFRGPDGLIVAKQSSVTILS